MKQEDTKEAASQQEFEIRKKNKKTTSALGVDTQSHALPGAVRTQFSQQESDWFKEDQGILGHKAAKNELESFSYDFKNNLIDYGQYVPYCEPAQRQEILKQLQETIDWIYGNGQSAPAEEYRKRLDMFAGLNIKLKDRFLFHTEIDIYINQFKNFAQEINDKLAAPTTNLTE